MDYPAARRDDIVDTLHGHEVADPYRWLEDATSDETQAWAAAQDDLRRTYVDALPGRERVRARMHELLGAGYVSVPVWRGERSFFMRRSAEQEHGVLYLREPDGAERALIDPMAIDPSGTTTLDAWQPSKEGHLLAYQLSIGGNEESLLRVVDLATGDIVDGPIDRTRYSAVAFLPGGAAYYYVRRLGDDVAVARRVWLHRLGTDAAADTLIWGDGLDETNYYGVSVSRNGRWLTISASAGTAPRNDLWFADLSAAPPESPALQAIQVGVDAQTSCAVGPDGRLYVFTDRDAPRGRLLVTAPEQPQLEHWTELIPESDANLEGYAVTDDALVVLHTRHAVSEVSVRDRESGAVRYPVDLGGIGSVAGLSARPEGGHEVWLGYTDYVTPPRISHLDLPTAALTRWADPPGTVDLVPVTAQQVTYASKDGTDVTMFVLHRTGLDLAGGAPTILYGYGGFNVPMTPGYSAGINAWVEAGGVYAIANLRGGSEEGEDWHRAGMRAHKQNVFDDLHAAAEWLRANDFSAPDQLGISGGSNGGLLVGAALTQRPDLYRAVVCSAPLLDMVRYEQFGLGITWNDEYGRADDPEEFGWLLAYSPYHHVVEGVDYPAVLFTVFDSDTRVDPMHARKMAAALQHATASTHPVLFRREVDVGHGARSISRSVDLAVDTTTFLAYELGLDLTP